MMLMADNSPSPNTPKIMPATHPLLQDGRYRINNEFPHEGGGSVYDAYDTVSETNVIVKEISVKLNKVTTTSQRENLNIAFADHAKALTEVKHESLLHVRDYFSEVGRQYLVMESVDGDDLQALLDGQKSGFPIPDLTAWADQLLDALHYLHTYRSPIVHRNIRPENIRLNSDGKIKLMSSGLVGDGDAQATGIADSGPQVSSITYSPLEQLWNGLDAASQKVIISKYDERSERILKEDLDARSDIYSLGATLYHLVTANVPVDSLERSIEILEGRPDPLRSPNKIYPTIPAEISDVIIKAMEIKREYRFDSAAIMRQVLRTALVRVKEREEQEAREQEAAANEPGYADQTKQDQLREDEARPFLANDNAAETERQVRKSDVLQPARLDPPLTIASPDDDLLGVLSPPVFVTGARKTDLASDDITLNVIVEEAEKDFPDIHNREMRFEETAKTETDPVRKEFNSAPLGLADDRHVWPERELNESRSEAIPFSEDATVDEKTIESSMEGLKVSDNQHDETIESITQVAAISTIGIAQVETLEPMKDDFADTEDDHVERGGFSFGMPAMAIGAAVLIAIAIGVWMMMSSGTSEPTTSSTEIPSTTQNAPAEPPVKSAFQPDDNPAANQIDPAARVVTDPSTVKVAAPAAVKPKKPTPAKTPEPKKAVTVDDLINDN